MPRYLRLAVLVLIALLPPVVLPARAADPPAPTFAGPGDVYLALGDSIATGFEVVDNNQPGYPTYLHQQLRRGNPAITLENLGQTTATGDPNSGETSSSFVLPDGQLAKAESFILAQRASGKVVSPVTLSIGGNDAVALILPGGSGTVTQTLTMYRANLVQILDRLVAALTADGKRTGDLLVMNYYNAYPGIYDDLRYRPFLRINPDVELPRFNQIIAEEAAARGIPVVDIYSAFAGREAALISVVSYNPYPPPVLNQAQLQRNLDFHPREAGHRVIAEQFSIAYGLTPRGFTYLPLTLR